MGSKISALPALTGATAADGDLLEVTDVSDTTSAPAGSAGSSQKTTVADLGVAYGKRIVLAEAAPAASSAGSRIYSVKRGSRIIPAFRGDGFETGLSRSWLGTCGWWKPTGWAGTGFATFGAPGSTLSAGTMTGGTFASTNFLTQSKRQLMQSAGTAAASVAFNSNIAFLHRGASSGHGGFHIVFRWGFETIPATRRWAVGLQGLTSGLGNFNPSAQANHCCFIGQDTTDTDIQFMWNDLSGSCTKQSSGITSPSVGQVMEGHIYCAPNDSTLWFSLEKLFGVAAYTEYGATGANLPGSGSTLACHFWANNVTTASMIQMSWLGMYFESGM